jgi:hypothetical protein
VLLVVFLEQPRVVAPIKRRAAKLVDFNISASPGSNYRAYARRSTRREALFAA